MRLRYLIITMLFITSCGSRKVNKHTEEIEVTQTEQSKSEEVLKKDVKTAITTNLDITTQNSEVIIIPIDTSKPMIVNGKEYKNAGITATTNQTKAIGNRIKNVVDNSVIKKNNDFKSKRNKSGKTNNKESERTGNYNWLWIVLISASFYFCNKFKKC